MYVQANDIIGKFSCSTDTDVIVLFHGKGTGVLKRRLHYHRRGYFGISHFGGKDATAATEYVRIEPFTSRSVQDINFKASWISLFRLNSIKICKLSHLDFYFSIILSD